jgi:hypothetical protein
MTHLEQLQKAEIEKQQKQIDEMRQLATTQGFYDYYFRSLKKYGNNTECFHAVNDLYFEYFKEYRYSSYDSFSKTLKKFYSNEK